MAAKIEFFVEASDPTHVEFGGDPTPYRTGKKSGNNKKIRLRNRVRSDLRVCFKSLDGRPIKAYFESPLNIDPADPTVGWVQLAVGPTGGYQQNFLVLHDAAWGLVGKKGTLPGSQIKVSVSILGTSPCHFPSTATSHVKDIIIDRGN